MVVKSFLHLSIAATTATAAILAGALWFATHQSPQPVPLPVQPATIAQLQQLANPTVTVASPESFISTLRAIKNYLVRNPAVKTAYQPADFSWQRDLFAPLAALFSNVLLQKPDQAALAKILSLVDAIVDEFEAENTTKDYNAEVDFAAQTWRNAMYDAVEQYAHAGSTYATTRMGLLPLTTGIVHGDSRGATDLGKKILLKNKNLPIAQATSSASTANSQYSDQPNTDTTADAVPNNYQYSSDHSYAADDTDYVDGASEYDYASSNGGHHSSAMPRRNNVAAQRQEQTKNKKSVADEADKPADQLAVKKTSGLGGLGSANSTADTTIDNKAFAFETQKRETAKQEIKEISDFMKDFKVFHEQKQEETLREIQRIL